MSPQPSPMRRFPTGKVGSITFGAAPNSTLTIPEPVIAKMWAQIEEGVRTCPRGGAEVGGILVASKSRKNGVVVDEIVPLTVGYTYGPTFRLSALDLENLDGLMEAQAGDSSKTVVGFYRSQTRGDETFRLSDREIYQAIKESHRSFAADFNYYLILAPASRAEMFASLSMWNGKEWDRTRYGLRSDPFSLIPAPASPAQQYSLPAKESASQPLETSVVRTVPQTLPPVTEPKPQISEPRIIPVAQPEVVPAPSALARQINVPVREQAAPRVDANLLPAPGPVPQITARYEPEAPMAETKPADLAWIFKGPQVYAAAGVLLLLIMAAGYRLVVSGRPSAGPNQSSVASTAPVRIGFSADREGPVWKLYWDRAAMDVLKPTGAVLNIKEGNSEQQLNLTPADLSSGTIFYTQQGGDLVLTLQVKRADGPPIEEHVRVLGAAPSVPKSAERSPQTLPATAPSQAKAGTNSSPTELPRANVPSADKPKPFNPSPLVRPNSGPGETSAAIIRDAPPGLGEALPVAFAVPVAPTLAPPVDRAPAPARAPIPQPAANPGGVVGNAPSTAAAPSTLATLTPSPAIPAPAKINYVGPKPIQQIRPKPPANSNAGGVEIHIHVDIDARGKVTKATPIGLTVANPPLLLVTMRAAGSWEFEPARMDGRAIASEMDLVFRF